MLDITGVVGYCYVDCYCYVVCIPSHVVTLHLRLRYTFVYLVPLLHYFIGLCGFAVVTLLVVILRWLFVVPHITLLDSCSVYIRCTLPFVVYVVLIYLHCCYCWFTLRCG